MTHQQKKLWEKLTKDVRESGMDNFHARELYSELSKLLIMDKDGVIISLIEREDGVEVKINEKAYGNISVIGLLERIKFTLMSENAPKSFSANDLTFNSQKFEA